MPTYHRPSRSRSTKQHLPGPGGPGLSELWTFQDSRGQSGEPSAFGIPELSLAKAQDPPAFCGVFSESPLSPSKEAYTTAYVDRSSVYSLGKKPLKNSPPGSGYFQNPKRRCLSERETSPDPWPWEKQTKNTPLVHVHKPTSPAGTAAGQVWRSGRRALPNMAQRRIRSIRPWARNQNLVAWLWGKLGWTQLGNLGGLN